MPNSRENTHREGESPRYTRAELDLLRAFPMTEGRRRTVNRLLADRDYWKREAERHQGAQTMTKKLRTGATIAGCFLVPYSIVLAVGGAPLWAWLAVVGAVTVGNVVGWWVTK